MRKYIHRKHSITWTFIFSFFSLASVSQNQMITRYTDSDWKKVSIDSAFYFTEMVKEDSLYQYTSYWMQSKKLNCKSYYRDTLFRKRVGQLVSYYENGQTEDSAYFYDDGTLTESYHYYQNGKLAVEYKYDVKTKKEVTKAYDGDGDRIKNYAYIKESSFRDGLSDWQNYLLGNLNQKIAHQNGAPLKKYVVVVQFIVGKDGMVRGVGALTKHGYGMEEELIRVIKNSPRWHPAVYMGKIVNSYKKQAIHFIAGN